SGGRVFYSAADHGDTLCVSRTAGAGTGRPTSPAGRGSPALWSNCVPGEPGTGGPGGRWGRSAAGRSTGLFAVIAGAYVLGAELAWHHFSSGLAFGYPPSGVDVAALLLIARRRWPVVIAAIVVSEVGVDLQHHLTLAVALASALANVVEPVTGASFVRRFCG